jgi:hypothetical protein
MWDLAISEHGDLIFSANRDLAGISGTDLIDQRIGIRLRLQRASWIYDDDGSLGSNLHTLIGLSPADAQATANALVREALREMDDEISIAEIRYDLINRAGELSNNPEDTIVSVAIIVRYRVLMAVNDAETGSPFNEVTVGLPLPGGGA